MGYANILLPSDGKLAVRGSPSSSGKVGAVVEMGDSWETSMEKAMGLFRETLYSVDFLHIYLGVYQTEGIYICMCIYIYIYTQMRTMVLEY